MARKNTVSEPENVILSREDFVRLATGANAAQNAGLVDPDEATPDDEDELRALREIEGADETKWNVFRTLPAEKAGFVGSLSSAQLDLNFICQRWGPGRYRIKGLRGNGQYAGQRSVTIADQPASTAGAVAAGASGVQDMLALMERNESKRRESLKEWLMILGPIVGPIVQTWMSQSRGNTLADLTTALANMKALSGSDSQLSKVQELAQLVEVVKGIVGETKEATGRTWVDAVVEGAKEVGPALAAAISSRGGGAPAPAVQFGAPNQPALNAPPAQVPAVPAQGGDPMMQLLGWLQGQMPLLVTMAARDRDPALYAEVLLDALPEGVNPAQLHALLSRPEWWQGLSGYFKAAAPYQGWFTALRDTLIATLARELQRQQAAQAQDDGAVNTNE